MRVDRRGLVEVEGRRVGVAPRQVAAKLAAAAAAIEAAGDVRALELRSDEVRPGPRPGLVFISRAAEARIMAAAAAAERVLRARAEEEARAKVAAMAAAAERLRPVAEAWGERVLTLEEATSETQGRGWLMSPALLPKAGHSYFWRAEVARHKDEVVVALKAVGHHPSCAACVAQASAEAAAAAQVAADLNLPGASVARVRSSGFDATSVAWGGVEVEVRGWPAPVDELRAKLVHALLDSAKVVSVPAIEWPAWADFGFELNRLASREEAEAFGREHVGVGRSVDLLDARGRYLGSLSVSGSGPVYDLWRAGVPAPAILTLAAAGYPAAEVAAAIEAAEAERAAKKAAKEAAEARAAAWKRVKAEVLDPLLYVAANQSTTLVDYRHLEGYVWLWAAETGQAGVAYVEMSDISQEGVPEEYAHLVEEMRAALAAARAAITRAAALYPVVRDEAEADPVGFEAGRAAELRAEVERLSAAVRALRPRPRTIQHYTKLDELDEIRAARAYELANE